MYFCAFILNICTLKLSGRSISDVKVSTRVIFLIKSILYCHDQAQDLSGSFNGECAIGNVQSAVVIGRDNVVVIRFEELLSAVHLTEGGISVPNQAVLVADESAGCIRLMPQIVNPRRYPQADWA